MTPFEPPDSHHLMAARGWLELGNSLEARAELEKIAPRFKAHPLVVIVRWDICAKAEKWDDALPWAESLMKLLPGEPQAWINLSFTLHELDRTPEARDHLLPAVKKFQKHWTIPNNLACYESQLGELGQAKKWLKRAFKIGGARRMRLLALEDPDLQPLWGQI